MRRVAAALAACLLASPAGATIPFFPDWNPTNGLYYFNTLIVEMNAALAAMSPTQGGTAIHFAPITPDGYAGLTAAMPARSNVLTASGRNCNAKTDTPPNNAKIVVVAGAGASDGSLPLHTTVVACQGNSYVLARPNQNLSAVSATQWSIGSDQSTALNNYLAANANAWVVLPCGLIDLDATTVALNQVHLSGCDIPQNTSNQANSIKNGTEFLITTDSTSQPAFTVFASVVTDDFSVFYPGQFGVTANPVVYGALFQDDGTHGTYNWDMENVSIINAYDLYIQTTTTAMGPVHWRNLRPYIIHDAIQMKEIGETFWVQDTDFNALYYPNVAATGNRYLIKWSILNGSWFQGTGTGTNGGTCGDIVGNLTMSNVGIHGFLNAFNVIGADFGENLISDLNTGSIQYLINADSGSIISNTTIVGSVIQAGSFGSNGTATTTPLVNYLGACTPGTGGMQFSDNVMVVTGGGWYINSANMQDLTINGGKVSYANGTIASPIYLAYINDTHIRGSISNITSTATHTSSNIDGVAVVNASQFNIQGITAYGMYYLADFGSWASGQSLVSGNNVLNTGSSATINGNPTPSIVISPSNIFDKPTAGVSGLSGACTSSGLASSPNNSSPISGVFTGSLCAASTYILTFNQTAATGWFCRANDQTTTTDTLNQTGSSATTATLTGTTANNDVVSFACSAY